MRRRQADPSGALLAIAIVVAAIFFSAMVREAGYHAARSLF